MKWELLPRMRQFYCAMRTCIEEKISFIPSRLIFHLATLPKMVDICQLSMLWSGLHSGQRPTGQEKRHTAGPNAMESKME